MAQPKGDDGKGLIDALQELIDKLRKELNEKLDNTKDTFSKAIDSLMKKMDKFATIDQLEGLRKDHNKRLDDLGERIKNVKADCKIEDDRQQEQINYILDEL
jgi:sugar-specific transcriptional regulator TrmB